MKIGVIAGNFDCIHPGYIHIFKECQRKCDQLIILLHDDPSIERPAKLKPVLSVYERREMLTYIVNGCMILSYNTEAELKFLLESINPDVRFLGSDYITSDFTGNDLYIPIHYLNRDHGWSTTKYKQLIANSICGTK